MSCLKPFTMFDINALSPIVIIYDNGAFQSISCQDRQTGTQNASRDSPVVTREPGRNNFAGWSEAGFKTLKFLVFKRTHVLFKVKEFYHGQKKIFQDRHDLLSLVLCLVFLTSEASARHHRGCCGCDYGCYTQTCGCSTCTTGCSSAEVFAVVRRTCSRTVRRPSNHAGPNPDAPGSKQVIHSYLPQPGENVTAGPANATEQSDRP